MIAKLTATFRLPLPMAEIYKAEISTSCLVAALEGLVLEPKAAPIAEQIAVITKVARQTSELIDQIGDAMREQGNGTN